MMATVTGKTSRRDHRRQMMARRPRGHEKIYMEEKRFGYFPQQFRWRGLCYDVRAVERCWTVSRRRWGSRVDRLCFRVRCAAVEDLGSPACRALLQGTFDVYQDLNSNAWHMEAVVSRA